MLIVLYFKQMIEAPSRIIEEVVPETSPRPEFTLRLVGGTAMPEPAKEYYYMTMAHDRENPNQLIIPRFGYPATTRKFEHPES